MKQTSILERGINFNVIQSMENEGKTIQDLLNFEKELKK